jgi:hypothetical protein
VLLNVLSVRSSIGKIVPKTRASAKSVALSGPLVSGLSDFKVGLTLYLFQVFPNPFREFIFADVTRSYANDRLILVLR